MNPSNSSHDEQLQLPSTKYRVNQLDALMLDSEITRMVRIWIEGFTELIDGRIRLENGALIQFASKLISVYFPLLNSTATFGMSLQGMRYSAALFQRLTYILIDALTPIVSPKLTLQLRNLIQLLRLANYIVFLVSGHFPTLLHRVAQMSMIPLSSNVSSSIDYDYMNRQLVWQAMTEAAIILVPVWKGLLNPQSFLMRTFAKAKVRIGKKHQTTLRNSEESVGSCGLCGHENPAMTRRIEICNHIYCYYCYEMMYQRDCSFTCPKCA